jgi:hypothetical protein
LSDEEEENYLISLAKEDELLSENKKEFLKDIEVQKHLLEEANQKNAPKISKIDAVVWLVGLENINPKILFEYFSLEDFDELIPNLEEDIEGSKKGLYEGLEVFLDKLFSLPQLFSDNLKLKNIENLINDKLKTLKADFLFWKGSYEAFLNQNVKQTPNNDLKKLFARYKTKQIDEEEFKNWLYIFEAKDEIDKNLLNFVKNG